MPFVKAGTVGVSIISVGSSFYSHNKIAHRRNKFNQLKVYLCFVR